MQKHGRSLLGAQCTCSWSALLPVEHFPRLWKCLLRIPAAVVSQCTLDISGLPCRRKSQTNKTKCQLHTTIQADQRFKDAASAQPPPLSPGGSQIPVSPWSTMLNDKLNLAVKRNCVCFLLYIPLQDRRQFKISLADLMGEGVGSGVYQTLEKGVTTMRLCAYV